MPCLGHAYPITILEIQNLYSKNVYIAPTYRNLNGVYFPDSEWASLDILQL